MSRRIPKSVSVSFLVNELIDKHFSIRGQFSAFVRAAVIDHDERVTKGGGAHRPIEALGLCNAMRRPTCSICFPEGPPSRENWLKFMALVGPTIRDPTYEIPANGYDPFIAQETETMLKSIDPKPASPRVDEVTGIFPVPLTRIQRLRRWISAF